MPRLTRIRTGFLEDLAEQLRYTPRATVRKQVQRALALAGEIDPARAYREDRISQRLTGFSVESEDPALLVGEALLGDLSAFVERVTSRAGIRAEDVPGASLRVEALAERWGVSRKTIERYRRLGLVGFRAEAGASGVQHVLIPLVSVEAFERRHAGRLRAAGSFSRLTEAERRRMVRWAARYRATLGLSLGRAARRLSERTGRSAGAIVRAVRAEEERTGVRVFDPARPPAARNRPRSR